MKNKLKKFYSDVDTRSINSDDYIEEFSFDRFKCLYRWGGRRVFGIKLFVCLK
jgi:hypothetical protein